LADATASSWLSSLDHVSPSTAVPLDDSWSVSRQNIATAQPERASRLAGRSLWINASRLNSQSCAVEKKEKGF